MDFIDGRDLKTVLREKGKFEPRKAAEIIEQVCRGLEAAHSEAVIHRDLKPQNIMMDRSGKVTVMDFGIARSIAPRVSLDMLSCRTGSSDAYIPFQPVARDKGRRPRIFLGANPAFFAVLCPPSQTGGPARCGSTKQAVRR